MILFINKADGQIIGTIDGRVHSKAHLKMWIGDKETTERIVIPWKIVKKEPIIEEVETYEDSHNDDGGEASYRKVVKKV